MYLRLLKRRLDAPARRLVVTIPFALRKQSAFLRTPIKQYLVEVLMQH